MPRLPLPDLQRIRLELDAIERERKRCDSDCVALRRRAEAVLSEARDLRIEEFVVTALTRIASLLADTGAMEEVCRLVEQNDSALGGMRDHPLGIALVREHVRALVALARGSGSRAAWEAVERRAAPVIDRIEDLRSGVTVPDLQNAYSRFFVDLYTASIEAQLALGDEALALRRIELVKCRSVNRMQLGKKAEHGELERELRDVSKQIDEAVAAGWPVQGALQVRRRALWDLIAIERFAEKSGEFAVFDLERLRSTLSPEMAIVAWFWLDRRRLVVAAIGANETAVVVSEVNEEGRAAIDAQAAAVLGFRDDGQAKDIVKPPTELLDFLFPPAVRAVVQGKTRLVLSPHRSLHAIPLHAIKWLDGNLLISSFAVSYAPNLTVLLRSTAANRSGRPVLYVGVPERAAGGASVLEGAAREARYLREVLGEGALDAYLPPSGTKDELLGWSRDGRLQRFGALHLSCHGRSVDSDNPMESTLALYDADVDGLDIAGWALDADLVVLNACHSGQRPVAGRALVELPGDELFGLQAAFVAAGARQILCTLWPVPDDVASWICTEFHDQWSRVPADVALQRAFASYFAYYRMAKREPHLWACFFLTTVGLPAPMPRVEVP